MSFTIGCDPEFFLEKDGHLVSAIGHIKGTKEEPLWLKNGSGLQYDNVALEFCSPVCMDVSGFIGALRETFGLIKESVPFKLLCIPSTFFPAKELETDEAQLFGCSPDYNVWEREVNDPPVPFDPTFRTCGGHVHVGAVSPGPYDFLYQMDGKEQIIKAMDLIHGLSSLEIDASKQATLRRTLYGKAGCFRPKDYGVEYRTLSNFWLKSPLLVRFVYSLTQDALKLVASGGLNHAINLVGKEFIVNSINNPSELTSEGERGKHGYRKIVEPYISKQSSELFDEVVTHQYKPFEEEWGV